MKPVRIFNLFPAMRAILPTAALLAASSVSHVAQDTFRAMPPEEKANVRPVATSYVVGARGAHERTWLKVELWVDEQGRTVTETNLAYVELETGMHYWAEGRWQEAAAEIESFPDGALARRGAHRVIWARNLNTAGAVDVELPDGRRLRSHVVGLSYFDAATGESVLFAEVKDAVGQVVSPSQVAAGGFLSRERGFGGRGQRPSHTGWPLPLHHADQSGEVKGS